MKLLETMIMGFDVTDPLLIRFLYSSDTERKMEVQRDSK
jgi:hypothetical protein